jgi:hypothetical protein
LEDYTIAEFLASLSEDELEKQMIKLISEGYSEEELLEKLLEIMERKQKC